MSSRVKLNYYDFRNRDGKLAQDRREFVLKKKKQKTFAYGGWHRVPLGARCQTQRIKVFCFFFFKKEVLASYTSVTCVPSDSTSNVPPPPTTLDATATP
jgi:hypothetical protein